MLKKIIKKMAFILGIIALIMVLAVVIFTNLSPQFGGQITEEQRLQYETSENYKDGKFHNNNDVKLELGLWGTLKVLKDFMNQPPNTVPKNPVPVAILDSLNLANYQGNTRLIWFGHSTFLIQINSKNLLIDPMFGKVPAPHSMLGGGRFSKKLPIELEKLPHIDAVLISHDHYDHLDYGSIHKLKNRVTQFYTPLGVGSHLEEWGIEKDRIHELDWWEEIQFNDLIFRCTPAQHFSGRSVSDRANTLWSSWIIQSETENIFFSGDSGYGAHFKKIGEKFGPFDFAMMECGQYDKKWPEIHMFPEETAQAAIDIGAKRMMPIHWAAFKLGMHPWTEPVERLSKKAKALNVKVIVPKIGTSIFLDQEDNSPSTWWK
jgi:L-ascorbate metabolism protein UlaG (beta-lactamase superfamily)